MNWVFKRLGEQQTDCKQTLNPQLHTRVTKAVQGKTKLQIVNPKDDIALPSTANVGAEPSELSLIRLLKVRLESLPPDSLDVTIFERDRNEQSRADQNGMLDLHLDTGLAATKAAGPFE